MNNKAINEFSFPRIWRIKQILEGAGLSLRAGGWEFSPATKRVASGYFYWKIEEKKNQKKSLAVWFPTFLLCLPSNLKS